MTQEVNRSARHRESESPTIADVVAYWDRRPCNIHHSLKPVGTREYFDEVEARKYLVEPHIPAFAQFERWRGKRVLEVGCGIGTDAVNFARAGADYTSVELSQASIDIARKRFEVFGLAGRFLIGNAENLERPFARPVFRPRLFLWRAPPHRQSTGSGRANPFRHVERGRIPLHALRQALLEAPHDRSWP